MRMSKFYVKTLRETPAEAVNISHQLMLKSGMIQQISSGLYAYMPLAQRVINKINAHIRKKFLENDIQEMSLPILQPLSLWECSNRNKSYGQEMFKLTDRHNNEFCLGPTCEEAITSLVSNLSYKELPLMLYQITSKFRDEIRPKNGLIRAREFIMCDSYSFCTDYEQAKENYELFKNLYLEIFNDFDLKVNIKQADSGEIGGNLSHEFVTQDDNEIAHIFMLGDKYSKLLNKFYISDSNKQTFFYMNCYGIGISRLLAAIIEQHYDENGIIFPDNLVPFNYVVIPKNKNLLFQAENVYKKLNKNNDSLFDDRNVSLGVKFKDADLMGIKYKVIVIDNSRVELKERTQQKGVVFSADYIKGEN